MNLHEEEHNIVIQSITDALFALMKEKPFSEIKVTELIQKAGIARSTYYRNFTSKEDIVKLYFQNIFQSFQEKYTIKTIEQRYSQAHVSHVLEFLIPYIENINILNSAGISSYYLTYLNEYLMSLYGTCNMTKEKSFQIYAIAGAEYNLIFNWFIKEGKSDKEAILTYLSKQGVIPINK